MDWHAPGLIAPSNRTPPPRFVTDVVLELGLASHDDVHAAVEAARTTGARAEAVLVQHGVLDDERLAHALAERYGLDRLDLDHFPVDGGATLLVSLDTALRLEALPVAYLDGDRLLVAVADPAGGPGAGAIARSTGREAVPAIAPRHRLRALIEAKANRGPVPVAAAASAVGARAPVFDAAPVSPPPVDDHRVAELERELADADGRLDAAEERVAAATRRIFELEGDLERAAATIAAVRAAVAGEQPAAFS